MAKNTSISPQRWRRVKELLDIALASPAAQRRAALEQACGDDAALLADVQSFLALDEDAERFIEDPLCTLTAGAEKRHHRPRAPEAGERIGPYRVRRLLGGGGMGDVYLAVREDGFRQQVALKLISWGMKNSREIVRRFENERQILANLEHPYIARILDGGTSDDGLPYFAMEYVEGEPIDDYCARHELPIRRRLELFRKVCSAVQVAHQNLVVHRDLKPANILVTEDGVPKLLDFGIAKLLQEEPGGSPLVTAPGGQSPMTPNYASPEQVLKDPVTTASDVYVLGVLLYQLLSGRPPYQLESGGYDELVRVICVAEPTRPSTLIHRLAESEDPRSKTRLPEQDLHRLQRRLSGDLDAIVQKAMRKEPNKRYASVEQLSEDVRRHLVGLPVQARKGTFSYNAGKFLRRHKLGLAVALMIVGFAISSTVLWRQAVREREQAVRESQRAVRESERAQRESERAVRESTRAQRESTRAQRVSGLLKDIFQSSDPDAARGEELTVREVLDRGRQTLTDALDDEPEVKAELDETLAGVYTSLGLYADARELRGEAVRLLRQAHPGDHEKVALALNNLATALWRTGEPHAAEIQLLEAIEMRRRLRHEDERVVKPLSNLASMLMSRGELGRAEELYRQGLTIRRQLQGPHHERNLATSLRNLGILLFLRADLDEAEELLREALGIRQRIFAADSTPVATVLADLGRVRHAQGQLEEAEALYRQALQIRRTRLGDAHDRVAVTRKDLAWLLLAQGQPEAAGELLTQALPVLRRTLPEENAESADAESVLGAQLTAVGRYEEAEPYLRHGFEVIHEKFSGRFTIYTEGALLRLRSLYEAWGKPEEAAEARALSESLRRGTRDGGPPNESGG